MSIANPQAAITYEEQLVPSANRLKITKNNQRVDSDLNVTDSFLKLDMPPPISNKPFTKPPTEKVLLAFIKTLGYDEDPKEKITTIPDFVTTRLHQPWRDILSVLNRCQLVKTQAGIELDFRYF
ncbi:hypothetical protein Tco_0735427 [Tanacetum coccineum]